MTVITVKLDDAIIGTTVVNPEQRESAIERISAALPEGYEMIVAEVDTVDFIIEELENQMSDV